MTASEPLGTAAQEAARLVESLQGWWRENETAGHRRPEPQHQPQAPAQDDAAAGHAPSGSCRYCPWCRVVSATQHVRPEVVQHLVAGAESFAAALRELSRPAAADTPDDAPGRPASDRPQQPAPGPRTVTIPVEPDDEHADEEDH